MDVVRALSRANTLEMTLCAKKVSLVLRTTEGAQSPCHLSITKTDTKLRLKMDILHRMRVRNQMEFRAGA